MADTLIPIGSIVRIEETDFLSVVLGYYVDDGEQMFDYLLAPYPTGLASPEHAILADADAIAEGVSRGYLDEEGERTLAAAADYMSAQEKAYVAAGTTLEEAGLLGDSADRFAME